VPKSILNIFEEKRSKLQFIDKLSFCQNRNDYEVLKVNNSFQNEAVKELITVFDAFFLKLENC